MQLLPQKGAFPRPNVALAKNALPTSAKTGFQYRRQRPEMSTLAIYSRDKDWCTVPMVFIVSSRDFP